MRLWQLVKPEYVPGLDGEGSRKSGGRWNSPGKPAVYCSSSLALASLEILVNLPVEQRRKGAVPEHVAVALEIPDQSILDPGHPATLEEGESQALGDEWLESLECLGLCVPSSVVLLEHNVILNPRHPAMREVQVRLTEPFEFDERLLG